jgi:hypothetical protein
MRFAVENNNETTAAVDVPPKKRRVRRWWRKPADWVEPPKPPRKIGRPTNAERAARPAAQAAPAEPSVDAWLPGPTAAKLLVPRELPGSKPGVAKLLVPATPPVVRPNVQLSPTKPTPSAITMALPTFDRNKYVLAAKVKGDELVAQFQEKAKDISKVVPESVPAASSERKAWIEAANGLYNSRVIALNKLDEEIAAVINVWRTELLRELWELREGILRIDVTRGSSHLVQVDAWTRFVQSQVDAVKARLIGLHSRWLNVFRTGRTNDLAVIDKRFPPGSEPEVRRDGRRKYDQDGKAFADEVNADVED